MNTEEQERIDRFEKLRSELADLDDEALKTRFWELCHQVMEPVVELARTHTTPSIERSVLLRMGIDSVTTHAVVENVLNAGLLGKGSGGTWCCACPGATELTSGRPPPPSPTIRP